MRQQEKKKDRNKEQKNKVKGTAIKKGTVRKTVDRKKRETTLVDSATDVVVVGKRRFILAVLSGM